MSTRELPDFLKRGFPESPAPQEYPRPGRMRFPEMRTVAEIGGHDPAGAEELAWREWWRWVAVGRAKKQQIHLASTN